MRRGKLDLQHKVAVIHRSRVQGSEVGTKTTKANRKIELHDNVVEVMRSRFRSIPRPTILFLPREPVRRSPRKNFYKRDWVAVLRAKNIRPRPFYNTRHSYVSFLYSIGATSGFISKQTGDSIRTLEKDYAEYVKGAHLTRAFVEAQIAASEKLARNSINERQDAESAK